MKVRVIILFVLFNLCGLPRLKCQFYSTGEAPASIKWEQITTPHFKITYPAQTKGDAMNLARQMESNLPFIMQDMNRPFKKKLPVLIHSASVFSNGYVTLAPQRMELVLSPPRDLYPQDWITQLSLHELRHFAQLNDLKQGFSKWLSFGIGEIGTGLISAEIPKWYYEGDAVYYETWLSRSGRGRIPGFDMPLRTLLLNSNRHFSYDKSLLGSFRDYVPDVYQTGYHLVNYARTYFDPMVWPKVLQFTARHPYTIWPVAWYLKKNYSVNKAGLYSHSMDTLKHQYINQLNSVNYTTYKSINQRTNSIYSNLKCPFPVHNFGIVALQSGLNDAGSLVLINAEGAVKRLKRIGYSDELKIGGTGSTVIWAELERDPRWEQRSYSVLKTFDLKSGKCRKLTRKSRYFNPDFSPDGKRIAVVEADESGNNYLCILDAENGRLLQKIEAGSIVLQAPSWSGPDEILLVTVSSMGKQLRTVNLINQTWETVINTTHFDISQPVRAGKFIVFRSAYQGIENLFAIDRSDTGDIRQVTFSASGAWFPSITADSSTLYFSEYSKDGFNVCSIPISETLFVKIIPPRDPPLSPDFPKVASVLIDTNQLVYPVSKYNKSLHLFNIHSWLPLYTDMEALRESPSTRDVYPGIMLFSQNLLSTVISTISYKYDHGYHEFIPSVEWRGWYPVIALSGQLGGPQLNYPLPTEEKPELQTYYEVNARIYVPLLFNRGKYFTLIRPEIEYSRSSISYYSNGNLQRGIDYIHLKGYLFNVMHMSTRDIYPRWGQSLSAAFTLTPSDRDLLGDIYSVQTSFYFPGIFSGHHLFIRAGYQHQRLERYYVPLNRIDFPRGYQDMVSKSFMSTAVNYAFPLLYPDFALSSLLYLKRLRMNLFYDWSYGIDLNFKGHRFTDDFHSVGFECMADVHFFRIIFPFSAGIRSGYIPEKERFFNELIFGIELGSF